MNDDFLHQLRKDPPADFALRLKATLDSQATAPLPKRRPSTIQTLIIGILIGGGAFALTAYWLGLPGIPPTPSMERNSATAAVSRSETVSTSQPEARSAGAESKALPPAPLAASTPEMAPSVSPPVIEPIFIAGSPAVAELTTAVAERFVRTGPFRQPKIDRQSTGAGFRQFCKGAGRPAPDIVNASRRMTAKEFETCRDNGVREILEIKLGYEAIVIARNRQVGPLGVTRRQLYLALAKKVPDASGALIQNPHVMWDQIDADLGSYLIQVIGPASQPLSEDILSQLLLNAGCSAYVQIPARDCETLRTDGIYTETTVYEDLTMQKLDTELGIVALLSYGMFERNANRLSVSPLHGVLPTAETISDGTYPASRALYLYVKKHAESVLQIRRFTDEYVSESAIGPGGYLVRKGLIPLSPEERRSARPRTLTLQDLTPSSRRAP